MRLRRPKTKDIRKVLSGKGNPLSLLDPLAGTTDKPEASPAPPPAEVTQTPDQELDDREINLKAARRRRRRGAAGTQLTQQPMPGQPTLGSAGR